MLRAPRELKYNIEQADVLACCLSFTRTIRLPRNSILVLSSASSCSSFSQLSTNSVISVSKYAIVELPVLSRAWSNASGNTSSKMP